jgi:hypothetical protein
MSRSFVLAVVLAVVALAFVLYPLLGPRWRRLKKRPLEVPGTRNVTDEEIEAAIRAYRNTHPPGGLTCPVCGPRPESDALFCSACGRRLDGAAAGP